MSDELVAAAWAMVAAYDQWYILGTGSCREEEYQDALDSAVYDLRHTLKAEESEE